VFDVANPILWLIGIPALGIVLLLARGRSNTEARSLRRRERSHRPVISRKQGPTVNLAANAGKPKDDRNGRRSGFLQPEYRLRQGLSN
jgi:hypothetical protein